MDYAQLVARQRAYLLSGATSCPEFRRGCLRKLHDLVEKNEALLLDALHADLRKSPQEACASETGYLLAEIRHAIRHLERWCRPEPRKSPWLAWPAKSWVMREPFGVSLIIGPWNYPLQLLLVPLVSAIAAGNTAVLKPSEFAPATSHAVAKLLRSAFSDEHIAVVEGHAETSVALLEEKFDKIFFTGSTETGRRVMAAAAKHLTPLTLELGGKSPCIVAADAAIDVAARRIVWGKFMNAGQTCVAPDYLLVDEKIASRLIDALRSAIVTFFGSDPQQSPDYGRIIHSRHLDRLLALIDGENVIHGGQHDPADLYLAPTLLGEASWDAPIMQEEIFGPILPILSFKSLDETLAQLSQLPPPLALYLFTEDRSTRDQVVKRTRSGGVCVNDTIVHITGRDLPFGGLGESGMGSYHGHAGFRAFTHERSVMDRKSSPDPKLRYPPAKIPLARMRRLMRWFG